MSEAVEALGTDAPETEVETEQVEDTILDEQVEQQESTEEEVKASDDAPFPPKAVNALNRRDKKIGRLQYENREYKAQLDQIQQEIEALKNPAPKEPHEDDFENYGDYLKALATFREQPQAGADKEQPMTKEQALEAARQEVYLQQREAQLVEHGERLMQEVPEYEQLFTENEDILDALPNDAIMAFLEAENGAAAFYALAKEGKLESLQNMNANQAAMAVAQAQFRGEKLIEDAKKPKVTNAPQPMKGVPGTKASAKDITDMTPNELSEWVSS